MRLKYKLSSIVYMVFEKNFAVSIMNFTGIYYNGLEKGKEPFYNSLEDNGNIKIVGDYLNKILDNYNRHLFMYSKKFHIKF